MYGNNITWMGITLHGWEQHYMVGNNITCMGATGVKAFKILTFGPIRK